MAALALASAAFGVPLAGAASAAAPPASDVTVSTPADPITGVPGQTVALPVLIANNTAEPVYFTIAQRAMRLGDEGAVRMLDTPDPVWSGLQLPTADLLLTAGEYRRFQFRLRIPEIGPDTYLVGIVVTPRPARPSPGQVQIVGAVGGLFTIDVPGPRDRRLRAALELRRVVLDGSAEGRVRVTNVGRSSLYFWADHGVEVSPGGSAGSPERISRTFLPSGHNRSFPVGVSAPFGIGRARVLSNVYHNGADNQVLEDTVTGDVWLVHPAYPTAVLVLLLGLGALLAVRLAHRHIAARASPRQGGEDHPQRSHPRRERHGARQASITGRRLPPL
jgi:hypothetical protein